MVSQKFPDKYKYHFDQFNLYQFKLSEEKLPEEPSKAQLSSMYTLVLKIDSHEMYVKYHDKWGQVMYAEKVEKIKDDVQKKVQQLLEWLIANDLAHLSETLELSEKYFTPAQKTNSCGENYNLSNSTTTGSCRTISMKNGTPIPIRA